MISTTAWVLHDDPTKHGLYEQEIEFPDLNEDEVLVEPLFGCWEANMTHAIEHDPVNIARLRRERRIVLGNAGVVRVLRTPSGAAGLREGDVCMFMSGAELDRFGYITTIHGYDGRGTVGLLARRMKCRAEMLFPLPQGSRFGLEQWAAFSLRYMTAWSNWKVAFGALRLQMEEDALPRPSVWGWGGGTTLATLDLARRYGCDAFMLSGSPDHLEEIRRTGVEAIDRRPFADLAFDDERFEADFAYRADYIRAERAFLKLVREKSGEDGASIVVDYIGSPVYRASLRALGRQGVITTAGWKRGMELATNRANECIRRHIHVYTHAARRGEDAPAVAFAEEHGWMPEVSSVYPWEAVPSLASDYAAGQVRSYFPIFSVNPV